MSLTGSGITSSVYCIPWSSKSPLTGVPVHILRAGSSREPAHQPNRHRVWLNGSPLPKPKTVPGATEKTKARPAPC